MRKQIKKYGNTHIINFTNEDLRVYDLKEGDIIDISEMFKINNKKEVKS